MPRRELISSERLAQLLGEKGISNEAVLALVVRAQGALGFEKVRNYDGSWTEYGSLVAVDVER